MILLILLTLCLALLVLYYFYFSPLFKIQKFTLEAKNAGYQLKTIPYKFLSFCWLSYV